MLGVVISVAVALLVFVVMMNIQIRKENEFVRLLRENDPELWRRLGAPREYRGASDSEDRAACAKRLWGPGSRPPPTSNQAVLSAYHSAHGFSRTIGKVLLLSVGVVVLLVLRAVVPWPDAKVEARMAVNEVAIGSPRDVLTTQFGYVTPTSVESTTSSIVEEYRYPYAVARVTNGMVTAIRVWGAAYRTDTGIRPGDSMQRLLRVHGQPDLVGGGRYHYMVAGCGYVFAHRSDTITEIELACAASEMLSR